jgi:hypothetical protein
MKTESTYSLNAILVAEFGITCKSNGLEIALMTCSKWCLKQGEVLAILFFMEVLILACWNIWILSNGKIFNGERHTFARWKARFIHDISLLQYRIKAKFKDSLLTLISSLP